MNILNHLNRMTYFSAQTVMVIYNKKNTNDKKLFITYVCRMRDTTYDTVKKMAIGFWNAARSSQLNTGLCSKTHFAIQNIKFIFVARYFQGHLLVDYHCHPGNMVKWFSLVLKILAYMQVNSKLRSKTQLAIQNLEFKFRALNFQGHKLVDYHCFVKIW